MVSVVVVVMLYDLDLLDRRVHHSVLVSCYLLFLLISVVAMPLEEQH